jgi:hypothetical protein
MEKVTLRGQSFFEVSCLSASDLLEDGQLIPTVNEWLTKHSMDYQTFECDNNGFGIRFSDPGQASLFKLIWTNR